MKKSCFNRFSATPLAALGLVVSVSLMQQAQAATDTSLTNQTISTVIDNVGGPNVVIANCLDKTEWIIDGRSWPDQFDPLSLVKLRGMPF